MGNNGSYPSAGGACSGYLLEEGNTKILLDCGNGVLSNLLKFTRFEELDAIILSHLHSDHMSDMMVLRYGVQIKKNRGLMDKPIRVFAPSEPVEDYNRLNIDGVFDLKPTTKDLELNFGTLKLNFSEMKHPVKCFAVSVYNGTKKFVFSGDTAWNQNIIEFAKDSDLLMIDAGLLSKDKTSENVPHLTPRECGTVARDAGVKKLLLTHFWPEDDTKRHIEEAIEEFPNVDITRLLKTYEI